MLDLSQEEEEEERADNDLWEMQLHFPIFCPPLAPSNRADSVAFPCYSVGHFSEDTSELQPVRGRTGAFWGLCLCPGSFPVLFNEVFLKIKAGKFYLASMG